MVVRVCVETATNCWDAAQSASSPSSRPPPPRPAPPARAGGSVSVSDTEPSRAQHIYTLNITLHCEQGLYLHLEYGTVEH